MGEPPFSWAGPGASWRGALRYTASMFGYTLRRLVGIVPVLLILLTVSFFVVRLAPGGPFASARALPARTRAELERLYGLERPLGVQYLDYLDALAHGNLGPSYSMRDDTVAELIGAGLPVSATLGGAALLLGLALGLALGIGAALHPGAVFDRLLTLFAALSLALPSFVTGPLLALAFGLWLHWLPVAGWRPDAPRFLILPAVTLALPLAASVARLMRASLLEVLQASYVRTARARGLGRARVLWHHALRPALVPVVSYLGPAATYLVTGSLVVETVFELPGTGRYLVQGAIDRDYTLVMGMVLVYGLLTLLANLAADLVHAWLDPRVRHDSP